MHHLDTVLHLILLPCGVLPPLRAAAVPAALRVFLRIILPTANAASFIGSLFTILFNPTSQIATSKFEHHQAISAFMMGRSCRRLIQIHQL